MLSAISPARQLELNVGLTLREFNIQQDLVIRTRRALSLVQNRKDEAHTNYLNSLTGFRVSYYTLCMLCDKEF